MLRSREQMAEFQPDPNRPLRVVGRYALYGQLAAGGMATVHFGRLLGPVGFSRTVAIKRLHPQFAKDPEFVAMFLDEARLAARIQHPNVVATVDVVAMDEELFLVMEYVRGESFSRILRGAKRQKIELPEAFISNVVAAMLHGLHAAHEATDEHGQPLHVVHRDVSPQNVLVGTDGQARVLDFGVAKAAARIQVTRDGQMKGKLAYMSPEQLSGVSVDRRTDVFAAGVVLWEALTGERLFTGEDVSDVLTKILREPVPPPSSVNPKVRREVDQVVMHALDKNPETRFQTAREFAVAMEETMQLMSPRSVGEWVERIAGESLERRERALAEIESISSVNELSGMTPSDPMFMRTLKTQVRGAGLLKSLGAKPPLPARPPTPGSGLPQEDDAATTVYHVAPEHRPPLPPNSFAQVDAPPAVIINDYVPSADTGLGPSPFRTDAKWKPYAVWAGGGMLAMGVLYLLFSALTPDDTRLKDEVVETAPPKKKTPPPPKAETVVVAPEDLPKVEEAADTEVSADNETEKPPTRHPSKSGSGAGSKAPSGGKKRGACAQPWYVDGQGIRRIKPDCL
jgi:eukaryotic-like serine/threonine-protein kinase